MHRFESLEARDMLAADPGWQAANYSMADDAQTVPVVVAHQEDSVDVQLERNGPISDSASQLLAEASELPPADVIDTLRILKDLDAIQEHQNGAAGLPEPGDEDVDPRTRVFDLLGDGSSKPHLPGASQGDDRGQMLDAMLETFRGGASHGNPWCAPGESSAPQSQDPPRNPFERVGWAGDGVYKETPRGWSYMDRHNESGRTVVYFGTGLHEPDPNGTRETIIEDIYTRAPGGVVIVHRTITYYDAQGDVLSQGHSTWAKLELSPDELAEAARRRQDKREGRPENPDDDQPNPADDARGLTFINPDPWALFLAWYTGQKSPDPYDPWDDNPGGTVESSGSASAAPRVGLEAVINPGDSNFVTRPSGGGRDPSDGPIGPPEL